MVSVQERQMPEILRYVLATLGVVVAVGSLTRFAAELKATQAGFAHGLFIALIALLPPGKISMWGNSYEPLAAARADEVSATAAQLDALSRRLTTLERLIAVTVSPTSLPEQKAAANLLDEQAQQAQQAYRAAQANADAAQLRYIEELRKALTKSTDKAACRRPVTNDAGGFVTTNDGQLLMTDGQDCGN